MAMWKFHDHNSLIGQQKEFIQVFSHIRYLPIKEKVKLHYQTDTSYWCLLFCCIYGPMSSKAFNHQIKGPMSVIILVLISLWTQEYFINIRFFCMSLEMMGTYSLSDERWYRIWLVDLFFHVFLFIFSNYLFCFLWKYTQVCLKFYQECALSFVKFFLCDDPVIFILCIVNVV